MLQVVVFFVDCTTSCWGCTATVFTAAQPLPAHPHEAQKSPKGLSCDWAGTFLGTSGLSTQKLYQVV